MKHYKFSTIKCLGELDIFSDTGPHKVPYVLSRCQYGIISGTTHIKTIFSFSPDTGKRFICNALCNSDHSFTQLLRILHFMALNDVFYKPTDENIQRSQIWRTKGPGNGPPFLSNDEGTSCPERHEYTIWLENCSHRNMTQSSVLHHSQRSVTSHKSPWFPRFPRVPILSFSAHINLWDPVHENVSLSPIHFMADDM